MNPRHILLLAVILASSLRGAAAVAQRHVVDSLRLRLSQVHTAADSVPVMYNLFDALPRDSTKTLADNLYHTAMRAGDNETALDMLRNMANRAIRNDSLLQLYRTWALRSPDGNDRKETLTFIRWMQNFRNTRYGSLEDRRRLLTEYQQQLNRLTSSDLYERIALTHGMCLLLGNDPNTDLLAAYIDSLGALVRRLPPSALALRTAYNVHVASTFAISRPEKSIEADMQTLDDLEKIERIHKEKGYPFRDYDINRFLIYNRLLSNYQALDSARVEEYYARIQQLSDTSPDLVQYMRDRQTPQLYYAMFHKDYATALPILKKAIDSPRKEGNLLKLLPFAIEASKALGDKATQMHALEQYSDALHTELQERTNGSFRELQTAYAIYDLRYAMNQADLKRREAEAAMQTTVIIVTLIALAVMTVLALVLLRLYRRNRQMASTLAESNRQLQSESDSLRHSRSELIRARDQAQKANNLKADFIKNMSYEVNVPLQAINEYSHLIADCVGAAPARDQAGARAAERHLARFAELLELNSELLSTIVNDVLRLSEIDSDTLAIQAQVVNINHLCDITVASVAHRVKEGVELRFDHGNPNDDLFTDPARLQQILNNLLTNAAKFTARGNITLAYAIDPLGKDVTFTVTDTGIGINPENKEKIFDRFTKIDADSQGAGLGLTISRMLARTMGGDLRLDTSYSGGARFILTLPKR